MDVKKSPELSFSISTITHYLLLNKNILNIKLLSRCLLIGRNESDDLLTNQIQHVYLTWKNKQNKKSSLIH